MSTITNINEVVHNLPLVGDVKGSLIQNIDAVDANNTYVAVALPGTADSVAAWKIWKVATNATITKIRFADGSTQFNKEWDERATYTYA